MEERSDTSAETATSRRSRRDDGSTFIEMLISIVLIGTAGIAVLTALAAATRGAATHRDISEAQAWLANAGDALTDPHSLYVECDLITTAALIADSYELSIIDPITASTGAPTIEITSVEFWNSVSPGYGGDLDCHYTDQGDRLQRITIETTIDGETRTLAVVKRPDLPPTINTQAPPTTLGGGTIIPEPTPGI